MQYKVLDLRLSKSLFPDGTLDRYEALQEHLNTLAKNGWYIDITLGDYIIIFAKDATNAE